MDDKRNPLEIAGGILDNIFSITDKFISSLASLGKRVELRDSLGDISEQLDAFAETLKQIPLAKRSLSVDEAEALHKIFRISWVHRNHWFRHLRVTR